jgi:ATP-dependent Lon protease
LGGIHDEAEIRGHRKTYIGAMPGRIINDIKQANSKNPLILLDEVDKLGNDFRGDPSSALLEVLDAEQNNAFCDHYIEIPFDLSDVLFITTANTIDSIPAPLIDRMEIIYLSSYTKEEKFNIAKIHLIPKQVKKHGLNKRMFKITDLALNILIEGYTKEAGVRSLERIIASTCRKVAKKIASGDVKTFTVTPECLNNLIGPVKYKNDQLFKIDEVGVANGLAWTSVGGVTLQIEASVVDGTGKIELTGSLGDVMKESAKAAVTYIRSRASRFGIKADFYKTNDIHIHAPEGAIPKDGPSAGITIATALASALTGIPVRHDVAMTGEITLRGRVLPIGGLKEKTMAAYTNGIKTVIIPLENEPDLAELSDTIKNGIRFIPVSDADTVLSYALTKMPRAEILEKSIDFNSSLATDTVSPISSIPQ